MCPLHACTGWRRHRATASCLPLCRWLLTIAPEAAALLPRRADSRCSTAMATPWTWGRCFLPCGECLFESFECICLMVCDSLWMGDLMVDSGAGVASCSAFAPTLACCSVMGCCESERFQGDTAHKVTNYDTKIRWLVGTADGGSLTLTPSLCCVCPPHTTPSLPPSPCVCSELGKLLRVNILAYDYTGYGPLQSRLPSVAATHSDISAALDAAESVYGIKRGDVVLYGQSVGSGPTVRWW